MLSLITILLIVLFIVFFRKAKMRLMWKGFFVGLFISIFFALFSSGFLFGYGRLYEILNFVPIVLLCGGLGALIGWIKEDQSARSLVLVGVGLTISLLSGQIIFMKAYSPYSSLFYLFSFAYLFGVILLAYGISLFLQVKVFKKEDIERLDQFAKIVIPALIFGLLSFMTFSILNGGHFHATSFLEVISHYLEVSAIVAIIGTGGLLLEPENIGIGAVIFIIAFVVANLTCHFVSCSINGKRGLLVGIPVGFFVYAYSLTVITKSLEIFGYFRFRWLPFP
jgi:hypothetical protein